MSARKRRSLASAPATSGPGSRSSSAIEGRAAVLPRLASVCRHILAGLIQFTISMRQQIKVRRTTKRLQVCEMLSLGDKRFLAIVQVDQQQFLLGGSAHGFINLAQLQAGEQFSDVLQHECELGRNLP